MQGEDAAVVGSSSDHQSVITISICDGRRHIISGKVIENHIFLAFCFPGSPPVSLQRSWYFREWKHMRSQRPFLPVRSCSRSDICLCNSQGFLSGLDRAAGRSSGYQSGSLFQKILNLYAVFANDVDKIASCFVFPWLVCIQGTEFTGNRQRRTGSFRTAHKQP